MEHLPRLIIWNHLLFEGTFFLSGYFGEFFALQRSRVAFYIVRCVGKIHNYIYRNNLVYVIKKGRAISDPALDVLLSGIIILFYGA
jgi:hypothetical protein